MKKRILSILTMLCLIISLMPAEALAGPSYILTVGNTNVSGIYEGNWDDTSTHYWKAAVAGDNAYEETGTPDDYLFSVSLDNSDVGIFTLTLNGVSITSYYHPDDSYDFGIFSNISLNIVLAGDTTNSIVISDSTAGVGSYGIFGSGAMTISGDGSLSTSGGTYGISSWGGGASLDVTGGTINSSGSAFGILVDGNVTISGGTVSSIASDYDGIAATGNLSVSGGNITASGGRYALKANAITTVSMDSYKYRTNTDASAPDTNYTLFPGTAFENDDGFKYVEIMSCPRVCVSGDNTGFSASSNTVLVSGVADSGNTSYWLNHVSGSITSTGASADTYNVKYNEATRTLTLNGALITKYYSQSNLGIYAQLTDLNIVLEGHSVIGSGSLLTNAIYVSDGSLSISSDSGGTLTIIEPSDYGIRCWEDISINDAAVAIYSSNPWHFKGIHSENGDFSLTDSVVSITSGGDGIWMGEGDVIVTGEESILNITASCAYDAAYGIYATGKILIDDAEVNVEKRDMATDAIWANDDIRISGDANMSVVDWSETDYLDCGLHSDEGNVAIGEEAQIDICSQSIGIYADDNVYIGYLWNGSTYAASGSPTVTINDPSSIAAITPLTPDDFTMGPNAIKTDTGEIYMAEGTLTSAGGTKALDTSTTNLPAIYRYKINTLPSSPGDAYTLSSAAPFENDAELYKYVEITSTIPAPPAPSGGGSSSPSRTITVTETSSGLFTEAQGEVQVEANMTNAFSNSVEVKVTDTDDGSSGFNLGIGNTVYPFDISLYVKGTNTKTKPAPGYAVTIFLPVPDNLLDVKEKLAVAHKADNGTVSTLASQLKQIDGIWYLVFEATEFSPYALIVDNRIKTYDETASLPYYINSEGSKVFIGFAAKGKYIAPADARVLFMENPKLFKDISKHWGKAYIDFATERELFVGTDANLFSPDLGMTRAMFATVVGRLYERSYGAIEVSGVGTFSDCAYDDYYGKYVDWAAKNSIISGYGNGEFGPDDPVTREQMASILYRFANFLGALPSSMDTQLAYHDASSISSYAKSSALYCQTTGVIKGRASGEFAPQAASTRAEVATILRNFIEAVL